MMSALICVVLCAVAAGEGEAEDLSDFPDPLTLADGRRVETEADWELRREQVRDLLLQYQYGRPPQTPPPVRLVAETEPEMQNDGATAFRRLRLAVGEEKPFEVGVHLYAPARGDGPFPAILRIGLGCPIIGEVNDRGYIFACFDNREFDPDTEGYDEIGPAQAMCPECDWASLAVWAWGASRVLDHLAARSEVDENRLVVTGHSRTGKAALLAGALDERFGVVVPNGSGCGGAAAYRRYDPGCETLGLITRPARFASWFRKDFRRFAGREGELPFDQHFLRALVAPRAVLSTDALGDVWANPLGTAAAYRAAQPVFDFLGVPGNNAMHFREGGHDQLAEDFRVLLDFADHHFFDKPLRVTYNEGPGE